MYLRYTSIAVGLAACAIVGAIPVLVPAASAAEPVKPGISEEASAAVLQMGKTLSSSEFSFQARTIRVFEDADGQPLHIFHTMKVVVHRPDRLAVHVTGDDGSNELLYDGKTVVVAELTQNKYSKIPAPNNIEAMMGEVMGRLQIDFPLADFLDNAPDKSFLSGVTSGKVVGTLTVDGKPYRHLFFSQAGGIELELWLEKTERAAPLRLIVTYTLLPGRPNFIAEFSDWNFSAHPSDAEFAFQPPSGAQQIDLTPAAAAAPDKGGSKR